MPQVQIQEHKQDSDFTGSLFGRLAEHIKRIEERAYELFERRGLVHGHHHEDWLQAESEINSGSTCKVETTDESVKIVLGAPGFAADQLKVNVVPGMAVVEGEARHESSSDQNGVSVTEESAQTLFHQIPLPDGADIEAASAEFESGELSIIVPLKSEQPAPPKTLAAGQSAS